MRVPNAIQCSHGWLISEIAPDFDLLDVWSLPAEGGRDDFEAFLERVLSFDPAHAASPLVRALFWIRFKIGGVLGWDDATKERRIPGTGDASLATRLPEHLRASVARPVVGDALGGAGFRSLYRTDDEWAGEISNDTVHGVLHFSWVPTGDGSYCAHMAIYVKTRGMLGALYMKLIAPFRHLIVYPALMRQIEHEWRARA